VREKPTVGSPFFAAFPSDSIPTATKDAVYISLFTVAIPENLYQRIPEKF
jgi:hypothetical protein